MTQTTRDLASIAWPAPEDLLHMDPQFRLGYMQARSHGLTEIARLYVSETTGPEVTDAMVNAALNAWYKMDKAWKGDSSLKRDMRDAIAAALKEVPHAN